MAAARSLAVLCGLLAIAFTAQAYSGDGTAYSGCGQHDKTGRNACGLSGGDLSGRWNCYYAALPIGCGAQSVDSRARCGDCIKVCGSKGCTVVKVIDQCASCSCGDVDLSTDALQATTGYEWDRQPITWEWLDSCDSGDSASLSIASVSEDTSASARSSSASSEEEAAAAEEAAREERRRKRQQRRRKERRDRLRKERQQRRNRRNMM
ncbi:hypothetical protein ACK3TF_003202 [Chlorella vulgaris]